MANLMSTEMLFRVHRNEVYLALYILILYTHDMWFELENMLVS